MVFNYELWLSVLTLICLVWASIEDIKNRLVPDKIWLIQIGIAIPLLIAWYNSNTDFIDRAIVITNIILGFVFGFTFLYFGAFGGGDSKALIAMSISSPFLYTIVEYEALVFMPPIFFFIVNLFVCFIILALILFVMNMMSIRKFGPLFGETNGGIGSKISILFSGRRLARDQIENLKHEDPAERFNGAWFLYTPLFETPLEDDEYEIIEREARAKAWEDISNSARTYLWTRPQPPGLVLFIFAYLYMLIFGSPALSYFS